MVVTLLNLLLASGLLFILYRSLRRASLRWKATTEPTCAACGYVVLGLTTPTCPECGNNLHIVGVLPPGKRRLSFGRALVVSLLFFLACAFSAALLGTIERYSEDVSYNLGLSTPNSPAVIIDLYATGFSRRLAPDEIHVYVFGSSPIVGASTRFGFSHGDSSWQASVPTGLRANATFDYRTGVWTLTDPIRSVQTKAPTDSQVDAWLTAIGCPSDPARAHELAQIVVAAKDTPDLQHFTLPPPTHWESGGRGSSGSAGPDDTLQFANAWLFVLVWAYCLRYAITSRVKTRTAQPPRIESVPKSIRQ